MNSHGLGVYRSVVILLLVQIFELYSFHLVAADVIMDLGGVVHDRVKRFIPRQPVVCAARRQSANRAILKCPSFKRRSWKRLLLLAIVIG